MDTPVTRRRFIHDAACTASAIIAGVSTRPHLSMREPADGRFRARPSPVPKDLLSAGPHTLASHNGRDTLLYVPAAALGHPAPLLLGFHGATMDMTELRDAMHDAADASGIILALPSSEDRTWDAIHGAYDVDLTRADETLSTAFQHCAVDARRVAIAGFSDGGSYAVSLGLVNGDLFSHIIAMSAGFIIPGERHGHPKAFIAHGTHDRILPIDQCGRRIAHELEGEGYAVEFVEFDGRHEIRPEIVARAFQWFAG